MAIKITSTREATSKIKILCYGKSGVRKTRTCATAKNPIIISSESKLMALKDFDIPVIKVSTLQDFEDAINMVVEKKKYRPYDWVCIDSITDIHEMAVEEEKPNHKDPRKAYGAVQDPLLALLRQIRDNEDKHWYIIAHAKLIQNDEGEEQYAPSMPGLQIAPKLPFIFDFVFPMRVGDEDEGDYSFFQCNLSYDYRWDAKDSSGRLKKAEEPNLAKIAKKILRKK